MDIRQLRYFIAIAEEKQITAAAQRLHMTQPPLGQQLKLIEQELGVDLILRTGKVIELTEAGQALYKHALHLTKLMEEAENDVKEIGKGTRGKLRIGVNTLSSAQLPQLLRIFKTRYPEVTYKIQQNESAQLLRLIREHAIELAIIRLPMELSDFEVIQLQSEPFYFVTAKSFASESQAFSFADIQRYPLILPSTEGLGLYHSIIDQFTVRGLQPNVIGECSDMVTLLGWVSSGDATTIVPESIVKWHKEYAFQANEIADSQLKLATGLIWLKDRHVSKAAQHFIELLQETQ
ncbi:LysR family transcriptional regulator [Paenibacillus qinlingensis]|uniref:DNA-binding transcriptional LysR family regulator n=1 Tax=Paenibacillus qinlingensis TaxID=1837343 RepID=A0ABU1NZB5_9BACL|nr:LysR family transcriptional regulator [Paenibacillus qinlingensis]MDR6552362.1 DNA-binding transcriptional LysR family regulator [Paenibacillus qinlingensis]